MQDEHGVRPTAFREAGEAGEAGVAMLGLRGRAVAPAAAGGRAWVVHTFGNLSASTLAYRCLSMLGSAGKILQPKAGSPFGVSQEEESAMQGELEAAFQGGSRELPFSFGYGNAPWFCRHLFSRGDPLPTGLMLSAWRAEFYWAAGTQWRAEFDRNVDRRQAGAHEEAIMQVSRTSSVICAL